MPNRPIPLAEERPVIPLWPDAGRALGLGRSATYDAAHRGEIPTLRVGGRVLVVTARLRKMLELDLGELDEVVTGGAGHVGAA